MLVKTDRGGEATAHEMDNSQFIPFIPIEKYGLSPKNM